MSRVHQAGRTARRQRSGSRILVLAALSLLLLTGCQCSEELVLEEDPVLTSNRSYQGDTYGTSPRRLDASGSGGSADAGRGGGGGSGGDPSGLGGLSLGSDAGSRGAGRASRAASTSSSPRPAGTSPRNRQAPAVPTAVPRDPVAEPEPPPMTREQRWKDMLEAPEDPLDVAIPDRPTELTIDFDALDALKLPDTDPSRKLVGMWVQTGGTNDADFANGGYRLNELRFRNDGRVDVVRTYGEKESVSVQKRIDYTVKIDGTIVFGEDPDYRPKFSSVKHDMPQGSGKPPIVITPPAKKLPTTFEYTIKNDNTLRLAGKVYRRHRPTRK